MAISLRGREGGGAAGRSPTGRCQGTSCPCFNEVPLTLPSTYPSGEHGAFRGGAPGPLLRLRVASRALLPSHLHAGPFPLSSQPRVFHLSFRLSCMPGPFLFPASPACFISGSIRLLRGWGSTSACFTRYQLLAHKSTRVLSKSRLHGGLVQGSTRGKNSKCGDASGLRKTSQGPTSGVLAPPDIPRPLHTLSPRHWPVPGGQGSPLSGVERGTGESPTFLPPLPQGRCIPGPAVPVRTEWRNQLVSPLTSFSEVENSLFWGVLRPRTHLPMYSLLHRKTTLCRPFLTQLTVEQSQAVCLQTLLCHWFAPCMLSGTPWNPFKPQFPCPWNCGKVSKT